MVNQYFTYPIEKDDVDSKVPFCSPFLPYCFHTHSLLKTLTFLIGLILKLLLCIFTYWIPSGF